MVMLSRHHVYIQCSDRNTCLGWIMGFLPDTQNRGLRMHPECRESFTRHRLQRKPLVSDPGMHHGTCVTQVPWCMSGSLNRDGGENVPGIAGACAIRNFTYLARGPLPREMQNNTWCHWHFQSTYDKSSSSHCLYTTMEPQTCIIII